jgi:uncharacterized iron-regulated protein
MTSLHYNTRVAQQLTGLFEAFIAKPTKDTYEALTDGVEAYRTLYSDEDEYEELGYDPLDIYSLIDG